MRRVVLVVLSALLLGGLAGELLTRNFAFRCWIGNSVRRSELQALVRQKGIYASDVESAWQGELFLRGAGSENVESATALEEKRAILSRLIEEEKLKGAAAAEKIESVSNARAMNLLRWQMRDEKSWQNTLRRARTTTRQLERDTVASLRARAWIEEQIGPRIRPNEAECRAYFAAHHDKFQEPQRLRASHIFLAAPEGYPTEVIASKNTLIDTVSKRLANGESFLALVTQFSEDEATKTHGGDLGYFAAERMLPAVYQAAKKLRPGELSVPFRSRLGFHILRLTEVRPARALTFEEAWPEISAQFENQKRTEAVAAMVAALP